MNKIQAFEQMRKVLQMFAATLDDEQAMEVATIYEEWKPNQAYKEGKRVTYGVNDVGDPQLYNIVSDHTSQSDWTPDTVVRGTGGTGNLGEGPGDPGW